MAFVHQEANWGAHTGAASNNGESSRKHGALERSNHLALHEQPAPRRLPNRPASPNHSVSSEARLREDESPTTEIIVEFAEARGVTVVAVTTDVELRTALVEVLPTKSIVFADSVEQALARPVPNDCAVLIVEQTLGRRAFEELKAHLKTSAPALVSIMVGTQKDGSSLVGLLSTGCIDRFMTKPLKLGPTRSALRSALQQHHSLCLQAHVDRAQPALAANVPHHLAPDARNLRPKIAAVVKPTLQASHVNAVDTPKVALESATLRHSTDRAAASPQQLSPSPFSPSWSLVFAAVIAVIGLVALGLSMRSPEVVDHSAMMNKIVTGQLAAALRAFELGSYVDPPELSATHFFNAALELDPTNDQAKRGLTAVADRLLADSKQLILDGDLLRAQSTLDNLRRMQPKHPELANVTASLLDARAAERFTIQAAHAGVSPVGVSASIASAATPAAQFAAVAPHAVGRRSNAEEKLGSQRDSRQGGALSLAPPTSAVYASQAPLDRAMQSASAPQMNSESVGANLTHTDASKIEPAVDKAELQAAAKVAAVPETATPGRKLAAAADMLFAGQVANDSEAGHAAIIADSSKPSLLKYVQPVYPQKARVEGSEGWVDVSFVVTSDGSVINPHIKNGTLDTRFHRAALAAVSKWKFSPASSGVRPNRSMNVVLEFKLAK